MPDDVRLAPGQPATVVINAHGFPYLNKKLPIAKRLDDLLSRMSLAEKVGQMTQAERQALADPDDIASYRLGLAALRRRLRARPRTRRRPGPTWSTGSSCGHSRRRCRSR